MQAEVGDVYFSYSIVISCRHPMPASKATKLTPTEIARETLIKLAGQKLAPTPENFRRIYDSISGTGPHSEGIEKLPAILLSALEIHTSPQAQKNLTRLRQCIEQAQWEQLPDLLIKHRKRPAVPSPTPQKPHAHYRFP